jgi:hypothetical protein
MALPEGDLILEEYRDVSNNVRMYALMRNGQLAILALLTSAFAVGYALAGDPNATLYRAVIAAVGLIANVAFFVMEERAADHWLYYRMRGIALEKALGFEQYTLRPTRSPLSVTNAFRSFHAALVLLWVVLLVGAYRF